MMSSVFLLPRVGFLLVPEIASYKNPFHRIYNTDMAPQVVTSTTYGSNATSHFLLCDLHLDGVHFMWIICIAYDPYAYQYAYYAIYVWPPSGWRPPPLPGSIRGSGWWTHLCNISARLTNKKWPIMKIYLLMWLLKEELPIKGQINKSQLTRPGLSGGRHSLVTRSLQHCAQASWQSSQSRWQWGWGWQWQ